MATVTPLTPAELRAGLEELLSLAAELVVAEERVELKAKELQGSDWEFSDESPSSFVRAIGGELRGVFDAVDGEAEANALDVCQRIQNTLDVLDFALARNPS